jgi:hypothetical protein
MVRHYAPSEQEVALAVKMQQCVLDFGRNVGPLQSAGARALVQPTVEFERSLGRGTAAGDEVAREAVDEAKDTGLNHAGRVEVREISTRMPSRSDIVHA